MASKSSSASFMSPLVSLGFPKNSHGESASCGSLSYNLAGGTGAPLV